MRKQLEKRNNERFACQGEFVRFGWKTGYRGGALQTVLLRNVTDHSGILLSDHLWFNFTKQFEKQEHQLVEGAVVEFEARVKSYIKGYVNRREEIDERSLDYKLSFPTKIKVVGVPSAVVDDPNLASIAS